MSKPTIGIRQADGSFYAIMEDGQQGKKRLLLSAAHQDVPNVKIDLFLSSDSTLESARRVGSLVLPKSEADPAEIELFLDAQADGILTSTAHFQGNPAQQTLTVDLGEFRSESSFRSDRDILSDPQLQDVDLDPLELSDVESSENSFDLPDSLDEPRPPSDRDILADESLSGADLDEFSMDDFSLEEPVPATEPGVTSDDELGDYLAETEGKPVAAPDETDDLGSLDTLDDLGSLDSLDSLDSFELDEEPPSAPAAAKAEDDSLDSLDDLGSLDSLDSLDLSDDDAGSPAETAPSAKPGSADSDSFSMDDEPSLNLSDDALNSDFNLDLPDLDLDTPSSPKPASTASEEEFSPWSEPSTGASGASTFGEPGQDSYLMADFPDSTETPASRKKESKKKPKAAKEESLSKFSDGVDRTALVLSLLTLGVLVATLLVLLFLNMVRTPQIPPVKPEVMDWKSLPKLAQSPDSGVQALNLSWNEPEKLPDFTAAPGLTSIPAGLKAARFAYLPLKNERASDLERQWGLPVETVGQKTLVW